MTSHEASKQMSQAIRNLTDLRNELGAQLCPSGKPAALDGAEITRINELHDRAARAIAAYHKGQ